MQKQELVFVPTPAPGHLASAVEFANRLILKDQRFSVTILLINIPFEASSLSQSHQLASSNPNIQVFNLPQVDLPTPDLTTSVEKFASVLIESHKSHVKDAILEHIVSKSIPLAGVIVDMFCSSMIDVANELGVPSYVFFPSGLSFLGFLFYIPVHASKYGREYFLSSDPDSAIPSFENPVPSRFLPTFAFHEDGCFAFLSHALKYKEAKGIIINTFAELEPYAIKSLESIPEIPKIYTLGPLLKQEGPKTEDPKREKIINWLYQQPYSSVIFLCFGSNGGFEPPQLAEIAKALEKSEQRFLWSIQKPPAKNFLPTIREYDDFSEVLPEGFLERTKNRGVVCGWAPQVEVLSHEAVGGFVSHCGWNSTLESVCYGVPIAAWPVYAEQQLNGFQLVKEMGLAVEVKLDYRMENAEQIVMADEIEKAIGSLMDAENPVRKKVKEISEISRQVCLEGGSSFLAMERLIADVLVNAS